MTKFKCILWFSKTCWLVENFWWHPADWQVVDRIHGPNRLSDPNFYRYIKRHLHGDPNRYSYAKLQVHGDPRWSSIGRCSLFSYFCPCGRFSWLEIFPDFCPHGLTCLVVDMPIGSIFVFFVCHLIEWETYLHYWQFITYTCTVDEFPTPRSRWDCTPPARRLLVPDFSGANLQFQTITVIVNVIYMVTQTVPVITNTISSSSNSTCIRHLNLWQWKPQYD